MSVSSCSAIGYGCSALGNLSRSVSEQDAQAVFEEAYTCGIRYFDTSPLYGFGLSELRLGAFARNVGRDNVILSTKVGRTLAAAGKQSFDKQIWHDPLPAIATLDYSYDGVMRSFEQSFLRTGIDRFDRVFVHDIDQATHGDAFQQRLDEVISGAYVALRELQSQGCIGEVGIGVNDSCAVEAVLDRVPLDCIMLAGEYTLFRQPAANDLFPRLESMDNRPALILCGIYNSGALAATENKRIDYEQADEAATQRLSRLRSLASEHNVELRDAALQFALASNVVDEVVVGASRPGQIKSTIAGIDAEIPEAFWQAYGQF